MAFVASFGHAFVAVAPPPSSSIVECCSLASLNPRPLLSFRVSGSNSTFQGWFDGGGTGQSTGSMKIVSRAGGSRPPPGSRRPRPTNNRQQPQEEGPRDRPPINGEISATTVMLLGDDGKLVGTIPTQEALEKARAVELDLVQLDNQNPPCVKIVQYSKYKYEQQKKKREQQKKSSAHRMDLKELKMRYNIDTHDYGVRLRSAQKFLKDGDKVKLIVQFKGREMEFKDLAVKLFERFEQDLGEEAAVESKLTRDGRNMSMVLAPNKGKVPGQPLSTEKPKQKVENKIEAVAVGAEA